MAVLTKELLVVLLHLLDGSGVVSADVVSISSYLVKVSVNIVVAAHTHIEVAED